ncbi:MAG: pilus assembly PilX N-terminal domain-containing protein [Candidatus Roizmanbacteria bacterium]|nr:pilus assembly PilX N-terminal domain-containing protein [Candidatus Roizmanbacteria bacterium]
MKSIKYNNGNSGQALIIIVLMIALVLTVIAASSYQLTVQTEGSKLQEESVRALAAADAGIEAGLQIANTESAPQTYTFESQGINLAGIDATRSEIIVTTPSRSDFVSSLVPKDDQFTFYTAAFPEYPAPSFDGSLTIFFGSEGAGNCSSRSTPALELTFISGVGNSVQHRLVEPCTPPGQLIEGTSLTVSATPVTVGDVTFNYQVQAIDMNSFPDAKMIIVRPLFGSTRLRFLAGAGQSFPNQGKLIESRSYSISGPSKIVTIFQSLPQLPADFFVTSF